MNAGQSPVAVRVPASSANLGPGFDVLGLALSAWPANEFSSDNPLSKMLSLYGLPM